MQKITYVIQTQILLCLTRSKIEAKYTISAVDAQSLIRVDQDQSAKMAETLSIKKQQQSRAVFICLQQLAKAVSKIVSISNK